MTERSLRPAVHFPPPTLFIAGIALGWLLEKKLYRIAIAGHPAIEPIGVTFLIAGLALVAWGLIVFAKARTGILPGAPANQIVTKGPYRFTRNPMYTGMAIAYIGGSLILNSVWCLILFPIVLILVIKLVIQPEEAYLEKAFPSEFGQYSSRVRRWI